MRITERTKLKPAFARKIALLLLIAAGCSMLVSCGGSSSQSGSVSGGEISKIYTAVPTDVTAIFSFSHLGDAFSVVTDTSFVGYGLLDPESPLINLYNTIISTEGVKVLPTLYTVQYSGRNEISLLQITDFGSNPNALQMVASKLEKSAHTSSSYNGAVVNSFSNGLNYAVKDNFLIASSSVICVESSLRHLANGSSVLNNGEFTKMVSEYNGGGYLFVNHKQIGKIFSGAVARPFLGYADFVQKYATWSALNINARQRNFISFEGESINNSDIINFSSVLLSSTPKESVADEILPASAVYAVVLNLDQSYLKNYKRYLDANKKLNTYLYNTQKVAQPGAKKPEEWLAEEDFDEIACAFCIVGGKYEWLTFTYKNTAGFFRNLLGLKKRSGSAEVGVYKYPGYIASLFGEAFSHTQEESFCKIGDWNVIGSARAISEFQQGRANMVTLKKYLGATPASSLFSTPYSARVWVNISDGRDTVLSALNSFYRSRVENSLKVKNFEGASVGVKPSGGKTITSITYYAAALSSPPQMFKEGTEEDQFFVDSTVKVSFNPHTLIDPLSGDTLYFEQSKKWLSISLSNSAKKTLWGIPMRDTLRSMVGFVTYGSKSYIAFIMGSKLYLISAKGAFANGYPKELERKVALGPMVIKENGEYHLLTLDSLNIISKVDLDGHRVKGWKDIHAPEFTHYLPEIQRIFGKEYYVLRTVFRTRIYTPSGEEVVVKDKKRAIAKDSPITEEESGWVRVMGIDGNEFLLNLNNGKTKKL